MKGAYWSPMLMPEKNPNIEPESISPTLFTHLFYASVMPDPANNYELNTKTDAESMKKFADTIKQRPNQKSLLSIGKRNETPNKKDSNSAILTDMAKSKENRERFIKSSIIVANYYGFDGLDLDWEFPAKEDMKNLSLLLQEWRTAIDQDPQSKESKLLLSAAVYFASNVKAYPIEDIYRYVDFLAPRCYDYHGKWETSVTAEHSCLRDSKHPMINTEYGISTWIKPGHLPTEKLVMGLALFGKTWKLKNPEYHDVGSPAEGFGPGVDGVMRYYEIEKYNNENDATRKFDEPTESAYSYAGKVWIGYDNKISIQKKVHFAKEKNLGGYFLWALGYDYSDTLAEAASNEWDGIAAN